MIYFPVMTCLLFCTIPPMARDRGHCLLVTDLPGDALWLELVSLSASQGDGQSLHPRHMSLPGQDCGQEGPGAWRGHVEIGH